MNELKNYLDSKIAELNIPGVDCIIYKDHKEVFRHTAGYSEVETKTPVKKDALYNIYSASKVITCTAAMQLVEQGKLCLEEPLYKYIPEFKDRIVKHGTFQFFPSKEQIKIWNLFTMTSGISYLADTPYLEALKKARGQEFSTQEFVKALAMEPVLNEPGVKFDYGYSHDVLAAVVEIVSGMKFSDYLKKNIFEPLGMKETGFFLSDELNARRAPQYVYNPGNGSVTRIPSESIGHLSMHHESGGGGLVSSTEDYILFADMMANKGLGKSGARILSEASVDLMRTNHLSDSALAEFHNIKPDGLGYGLGVAVYYDPAKALTLAPKGSFYWGGVGGWQNLFDPENHIAYLLTQHCVSAPKDLIQPQIFNIIYSHLDHLEDL